KAGRAATEEEGARAKGGAAGRQPEVGFAEEAVDELVHPLNGLACDAVESTVVTLVEAEGDMHVQCPHLHSRQVGGGERRSRAFVQGQGHRSASRLYCIRG